MALEVARANRVNLALIDYALPDMNGLDVVRAFKGNGISLPWILMSGGMDIDLAVEAMLLGASRAVSLPFDVERVVLDALSSTELRPPFGWPALPLAGSLRPTRSAAERWASLVLKGCDAECDLPTIGQWAAQVGVSYSGLREACRLAGIRPHDARDFMRILRILCRSGGRIGQLEESSLSVSDHRTLHTILHRAGAYARDCRSFDSLADYLSAQQFSDANSPAIEAIKALLSESQPDDTPIASFFPPKK